MPIVWKVSTVEPKQPLSVVGEEALTPHRCDRIQYGDRTYVLRESVVCPVRIDEQFVVVDLTPPGVTGYGATRDTALEDLAEEFAFAYDHYTQMPDSALTTDGLELKQSLRYLVKEVLLPTQGAPGTRPALP